VERRENRQEFEEKPGRGSHFCSGVKEGPSIRASKSIKSRGKRALRGLLEIRCRLAKLKIFGERVRRGESMRLSLLHWEECCGFAGAGQRGGDSASGVAPFPFGAGNQGVSGMGEQMEEEIVLLAESEGSPGMDETELGRGTALLQLAADKTVKENSVELAKALLEAALKGQVQSARLLRSLADGETGKKPKKRKRSGPSQAEIWENEPPWVEPVPAESQESQDATGSPEETRAE
jgi:hypothetical protein